VFPAAAQIPHQTDFFACILMRRRLALRVSVATASGISLAEREPSDSGTVNNLLILGGLLSVRLGVFMSKRLVALAFLSSSLFSTAGHAGDWSGFYIGAHAGYATGDWDADFSKTTGALIYNDPFVPDQQSLDDDGGWLGGFQVGGNYQTGALVVGVEADVSWTNADAGGRFVTTDAGPCAPNSCTQWDISSELEVFGTIRGRLGFATGNALIYGTGGLAWGITDSRQASQHNGPAFATDGGRTSGDTNHIGWTAGVGAEWKLASNWSVKGEYLYVDLGEEDYSLSGTTSPTSTTPWTEHYAQELELHTFRVGLNYKFGEREAPAPLK
jgi:outer membrane immunogenic protein